LDILINNAAYAGEIVGIEKSSLQGFTSVINTNLLGPFVISKEALPHIKEVKGSIIFVASIYGEYLTQWFSTLTHFENEKLATPLEISNLQLNYCFVLTSAKLHIPKA
jgi:NAD(P)-dependent dehydrogenase (short-subunit alcohol dehydrogenase family)